MSKSKKDSSLPKKVFVVTPRFGLCNQLSSITMGIVYAHIYKRNVYFDGFQDDYKHSKVLSPFHSIFNIDKMNEKLVEKKIDVQILKEIPDGKIQVIDPLDIPDKEKLCHLKDLVSILDLKKYKELNYLCIENPISSVLPEPYMTLENELKQYVYFNEIFIEKVELIKKELGLSNYSCIHMRLEDDAIEYMTLFCNLSFSEINNMFIEKYIIELERLSIFKGQIYVCTSLGVNENKNNIFYKIFKDKYHLLDKTDIANIHEILGFGENSRELYAIIDYIIATDSNCFIGSDWSSFSAWISQSHISNEKYYKNLDLYKSIKK